MAPEFIFGVRPPKFWTGIIKFSPVLTIVQNFTPVSPCILEISRSEIKTSGLKHKSFRKLLFSGGLIIRLPNTNICQAILWPFEQQIVTPVTHPGRMCTPIFLCPFVFILGPYAGQTYVLWKNVSNRKKIKGASSHNAIGYNIRLKISGWFLNTAHFIILLHCSLRQLYNLTPEWMNSKVTNDITGSQFAIILHNTQWKLNTLITLPYCYCFKSSSRTRSATQST